MEGKTIYKIEKINLTQSEYGVPSFINTTSDIKSNDLVVSSFTQILAFVCCIVEFDPDLNLSLTDVQVRSSKNRIGGMADFAKCFGQLYEDFELIIPLDGFKTKGDYMVTCVMCNYYPMNELCTDMNSSFIYDFFVSNLNENDDFVVLFCINFAIGFLI